LDKGFVAISASSPMCKKTLTRERKEIDILGCATDLKTLALRTKRKTIAFRQKIGREKNDDE